MRKMTTKELRSTLGAVLDSLDADGPVEIVRGGETVAYLMTPNDAPCKDEQPTGKAVTLIHEALEMAEITDGVSAVGVVLPHDLDMDSILPMCMFRGGEVRTWSRMKILRGGVVVGEDSISSIIKNSKVILETASPATVRIVPDSRLFRFMEGDLIEVMDRPIPIADEDCGGVAEVTEVSRQHGVHIKVIKGTIKTDRLVQFIHGGEITERPLKFLIKHTRAFAKRGDLVANLMDSISEGDEVTSKLGHHEKMIVKGTIIRQRK